MSFRYPHPDNEKSFEKFCLKFLRKHWNNPYLKLYGRRGEEQLGIDIIDPTFSSPFRAGQCKHHESDITIPPLEIQEEVDKALKFDPPLEHYTILTTGRVTTHGDKKVLEINREHKEKGLFSVELLSWSDIEDYLDDYPEVVSMLTPVANAQVEELTTVVSQRFDQLEGRSDHYHDQNNIRRRNRRVRQLSKGFQPSESRDFFGEASSTALGRLDSPAEIPRQMRVR
jgi:hypothetical protein